jgi:hypothetical protein
MFFSFSSSSSFPTQVSLVLHVSSHDRCVSSRQTRTHPFVGLFCSEERETRRQPRTTGTQWRNHLYTYTCAQPWVQARSMHKKNEMYIDKRTTRNTAHRYRSPVVNRNIFVLTKQKFQCPKKKKTKERKKETDPFSLFCR